MIENTRPRPSLPVTGMRGVHPGRFSGARGVHPGRFSGTGGAPQRDLASVAALPAAKRSDTPCKVIKGLNP